MSHLTVPVSDSVLAAAKRLAERERVSVEEYVGRMLAEAVRDDAFWDDRIRRGREVTRDRFLAILDRAPDLKPDPSDRLPE